MDFGIIKLHSYGMMVFLGFALATWFATLRGKKEGFAPNVVMDLVVWILVSSLIGSRAMYVMFHLNEFHGRWLDIISPIQSDGTIGIAGLVFLGGVLTAVPVSAWYMHRKGIPFLKMIDVMIPALALGMGFGRIGCFLNGCCFGVPTDQPLGMIFPSNCIAGGVFSGIHIHPTQLYAIIYNFSIMVILTLRTPYRRFTGELFYMFLALYGIARFLNETVRYYQSSMIPLHIGSIDITISMIITFIMFITGLAMLVREYRISNRGDRSNHKK